MSLRIRAVEIHQVPAQITPVSERAFLQDLQDCVKTERPRFVLDCSNVWQMDAAAIHLLLSCLEEVMKCNGDVRLASLRPGAEAALRVAGVDRLFEVYATPEAASRSFQQRQTSLSTHASMSRTYDKKSEHAA